MNRLSGDLLNEVELVPVCGRHRQASLCAGQENQRVVQLPPDGNATFVARTKDVLEVIEGPLSQLSGGLSGRDAEAGNRDPFTCRESQAKVAKCNYEYEYN
jgi:hypothetical protein